MMLKMFFLHIKEVFLLDQLTLFITLSTMQNDNNIRQINTKEFKTVELFQKKFSSFFGNNIWKSEEIKNFVTSKKNLILVAFEKDKIVGLAIFIRVGDGLDIYTIFVEPLFRNKSIGTKFLEEAKNFCVLNSLKNIKLEVNKRNELAINFYKKNNFFCVGLRKNYYGFEDDALIMELDI